MGLAMEQRSDNVIRVLSLESREVVKSYRDLRVWQLSRELVKHVYVALISMPKEEIYGLTSQIKRAVVSVPSNLAEGSSRKGTAEFIRYINIAMGSLAELETQLVLAQDLDFLQERQVSELLSQTKDINRMLQGLHDALKAKTTRLKTRDSDHEGE